MSQSEIKKPKLEPKPKPKGRILVVCFDGTSDQYNTSNSNVVKFFGMLNRHEPDRQLCYYQPGVGTYFNPGVVSPLLLWLAKVLDLGFAWYLDEHVLGGYTFLMENYREGDKICIFGFSRGACTARALAGALYKVGLLLRDLVEQVPFAYKLYKSKDPIAAGFKKTFSREVRIEFLGVWDTVASVGVVLSRSLPLIHSNPAITTFRHALSLDERRVRFHPDVYHQPGTKGGDDTDAREVWFSGCHGDIGGGSVPDTATHSLANITLRWMVKEVEQSKCGILFDRPLEVNGIPLFGESSENGSTPVDCDAVDALQPLDDELKLSLNLKKALWWIPEILLLSYFYQDKNRHWQRGHRWNLGRGRIINNPTPLFHVTVRERNSFLLKPKYIPNAQWVQGSQKYVD